MCVCVERVTHSCQSTQSQPYQTELTHEQTLCLSHATIDSGNKVTCVCVFQVSNTVTQDSCGTSCGGCIRGVWWKGLDNSHHLDMVFVVHGVDYWDARQNLNTIFFSLGSIMTPRVKLCCCPHLALSRRKQCWMSSLCCHKVTSLFSRVIT